MIKRTPQEIAGFFGCYVAQDDDGYWFMYKDKPIRNNCRSIWVGGVDDPLRIPWMTIDIPADHDWTHLYEPRHYSPEQADSDNKAAPYYEKQADSDNKHQSQVHVHAEYKVVTFGNLEGLEEIVSEYITEEGWRPQGGVYFYDGVFYQAIERGIS